MLIALSLASRVDAIHISFNYEADERPSFDPNGLELRRIANAAAAMWSDYILDDRTIELDLSWGNLDGRLAQYEYRPFPATSNIVVDSSPHAADGTAREWFFDPTPDRDEEFSMNQTLYRDSDEASYFGTPPEVLEAGYMGPAKLGSAAHGKLDLLTSILHEIGHELGINVEIDDDDWDVRPATLGGANVSVASTDEGFFDLNHLDLDTALMAPAIQSDNLHGGYFDERRLPSATDILVMWDEGGFTQLDLPRVDFIGAESIAWDGTLNWIGGRVPDDDNDVYVRHGGTVRLAGDFSSAKSLTVDGYSGLANANNNRLLVHGHANIGLFEPGQVNLGGVFADGAPELEAESVTINNGYVNLQAATSILDVKGVLKTTFQGQILGDGTVEVGGLLDNSGEIVGGVLFSISGPGELTVRTTGSGRLDLDGSSEQGRLTASLGNLRIEGIPLENDPFSGIATIQSGRTMTFTQLWALDGKLVLRGGSAGDATLAGAEALIRGQVEVDGVANISASLTLDSAGSIYIPDAADRLSLTGWPMLQGGAITGNGTLAFGGNFAFVFADTTINVASLDWDGDEGGASNRKFSVMDGKLTINSQQIDPFGAGYGGTLYINETGWLEVNAAGSWRVDKRLEMHAGSQGAARLSGSSTLIIVNGAVLATEALFFPPEDLFTPRIDAPLNVEGLVDASERPLVIGNTTTLAGGRITGAKTVNQVGDLVIWSSNRLNHIDPANFLWGVDNPNHTTTLRQGAELEMRTGRIGAIGAPTEYRGRIVLEQDSFLTVDLTSSSTWTLAGSMQMGTNAALVGDNLINTGTISGDGIFYVQRLENSGTVAPGNSIGALRIVAGRNQPEYVQTSLGRLNIELGGLAPGAQYDVFGAGSSATLGGALTVALVDGFVPSAGDRFDILLASSITGQFATLELLAPSSVFFDGRVLYGAGRVTFEVLASGLSGDFQQDGDVDAADLSAWKAGFHQSGAATHIQGDADGDHEVDGADFLIWQRQLGAAFGVAADTAVPEPGAFVLFILASAGFRWIAGRRR